MTPAVKPQTRADSTRNAGPWWPLGCTAVARLAGVREIRHGDREDPGRLGRIDHADRARARATSRGPGVTTKLLTGM